HNDPYILKNGKITTKSNHCGGIIGGISIGTPIIFRVPIKPTASIGKNQKTLNFKTKKMTDLKIKGRHDPCIVPRVLIAIEAISAIVLVDHWLVSRT
ncbi:MAG: chorismate synthase, partial [Promethearchaeota archaeon]